MRVFSRAGLCGWTVHDDKLDEWKRRRQGWFMQGKEGKPYKANSLYQFLRRLGFFPTEVISTVTILARPIFSPLSIAPDRL